MKFYNVSLELMKTYAKCNTGQEMWLLLHCNINNDMYCDFVASLLLTCFSLFFFCQCEPGQTVNYYILKCPSLL